MKKDIGHKAAQVAASTQASVTAASRAIVISTSSILQAASRLRTGSDELWDSLIGSVRAGVQTGDSTLKEHATSARRTAPDPRSVAVIGASTCAGALGQRVLESILATVPDAKIVIDDAGKIRP